MTISAPLLLAFISNLLNLIIRLQLQYILRLTIANVLSVHQGGEMLEKTVDREDDIEYKLERLTDLTEKIRVDTSVMTRDIQEEMIDILISTKPSKDKLKVAEIRDEAVRVLTWILSK